ncbi:hypothetical protein [Neobacillus niacini]|uniref:hypothetical protein n=1 Tax=Neobacillus niacini TaxID=86668 RepID=UPI0039830227
MKSFLSIEQPYNIALSILFVVIVLPVLIIEFYVNKKRLGVIPNTKNKMKGVK